MHSQDGHTLDQANLRRLLLFLEEYDPLDASWENAEGFLHYLRRTARLSFRSINRPYLQRLYDAYKAQQDAA